MGAPRRYEDPKKLEAAIEKYFKSITRRVVVTEAVDTGELDEKGHKIFTREPVLNECGKEVTRIDYIVPPTVWDLCEALGISESTWENYCDPQKHPEFLGATTRARGRMRAWNQMQLLTREGKDLKGIIFNLENNYGYREKHDITHRGIEDFLQELEDGGEDREF